MAAKKSEQTPLMDDFCNHCNKAYSVVEPHAKFVNRPPKYGISSVITDYEPMKFSSFRVFFAIRGTILQDWILVIEQLLITTIFGICGTIVYINFNKDAVGAAKGLNMREWLDSQEARMREFAMIMTILASLLLSFYTAMAVGRWWAIRANGIGGIKGAEMELEMMVSQLVTQEPQVLDAMRRYARASMILVFLWRRGMVGPKVAKEDARIALFDLVTQGLLTEQEVDQLVTWNHCLHETIWAWNTAIISMLHQQGKIKSDTLLRSLLERCSDGRMAAQVIHTHLAVKIPMQYVHLLGLLVKMHNLVLAVIMGSLFGAAVRSGEVIICCQLFGRTIILPTLFNAILLINCELSDPFKGQVTDFPGHAYSAALEKDGSAFVKAGQNMPDWMSRRNPLPV